MKFNQDIIRNNLAWIRLERGLNKKEFAEVLGVSPSLVSCWENRIRNVTPEQLNKVAKALEKPVAYFLVDQTPKDTPGVQPAVAVAKMPDTPVVSVQHGFVDLSALLEDAHTKIIWKDKVLTSEEKTRLYNIVFALLKN